jgi:hypothetical protein
MPYPALAHSPQGMCRSVNHATRAAMHASLRTRSVSYSDPFHAGIGQHSRSRFRAITSTLSHAPIQSWAHSRQCIPSHPAGGNRLRLSAEMPSHLPGALLRCVCLLDRGGPGRCAVSQTSVLVDPAARSTGLRGMPGMTPA